MKIISKIIYGILGGILLLGGLIILFNPIMAMPNVDELLKIPPNNSAGPEYDFIVVTVFKIVENFSHFLKETGAAVITLGVFHLWGVFNFQKMSQPNYILLLFWVIMAGIHWYEFAVGNRTISSPLINSIPTLLMTLVIFCRKKIDA